MTCKQIAVYVHIFLYNFRIPILPFANVVSNLNLIESFFFQPGSLIYNTLRIIKSYVRTREHHRTTGKSMIFQGLTKAITEERTQNVCTLQTSLEM